MLRPVGGRRIRRVYFYSSQITVTRTNPHGDCGTGIVLHGLDGVTYTYCHGSAWFINNGGHVAPGEELGLTGNTGKPSGPHLHFQIVSYIPKKSE
jgi:murein DD-endopeptidase